MRRSGQMSHGIKTQEILKLAAPVSLVLAGYCYWLARMRAGKAAIS